MKKIIVPALFGAVFLLFAACSAKSSYRAAPEADANSISEDALMSGSVNRGYAAEESPRGEEQYNAPQFLTEQRKLVKTANLHIRVEDLDAADKSITALMNQYSAYAANTNASEDNRNYVIRVPQQNYDAFLSAMSGMGRTLRRSESAEDVTLRYSDLEGRLATKKELLKTYQSYLGKAKDIEEILSVEARIADLQGDIDQTGKDLRYLANQVDYSTVNLNVSGPVKAASYRGPTLFERITELFGSFGEFVSVLVTILTGIVIYGIPILLLLAFFFWLCFGRVGLLKKLWRVIAGKR